MAYDKTTNPIALVAQGVGGYGKQWAYASADAEATFDGPDYFTDADEFGVTTGDLVAITDTGNVLTTIAQVTLDADGNGTVAALTATAP